MNEIHSVYDSILNGVPAKLPKLTWQYSDYVNWQQHWSQGAQFNNQLKYWQEKLKGAPEILNLPIAQVQYKPMRVHVIIYQYQNH